MNTRTPALLLALALTLTACEKEPAASPAPATPAAPAAPAPEWQPAPEPTYDAAIEVLSEDPPKYAATWSATVNTGGWTMTTDTVLVEGASNRLDSIVARVYVILEEPGPGEVVTQAEETLTGSHETDQPIDQIEFSVKRKVRGDTSPYPGFYVIVKNVS